MSRIATLDDYHAARHAHELALEAACGTRDVNSEEVRGYYAQAGDGGAGAARFTFKEWLRQTRDTSGDDPEEIKRAFVVLVQDAHARMHEAREAYEESVRILDMEVSDAADLGRMTYRELAPLVGVSFQKIGERVQRGRSARQDGDKT